MIDLLRFLLGEFYQKLNRIKPIRRDAQFPQAPNKIKVAMGMRRVGKTYLCYQHIQKLIESGVAKTSILYLNFEDDRLQPMDQKKFAQLVDAFYSLYPENYDKKCYLFFDEIQNVQEWPLVVRRLHDSKDVEIFLTGSSAKLLSKEIATSLRGRSLSVEVWPFSFDEYLRAKHLVIDRSLFDKKTQDHLYKAFQAYLKDGGFPEVSNYKEDMRQQTLQEYVDIVIYRDIIERHQIKNPTLIKYLILSMLQNIARPFSINKFYNDAKSQGYSLSKDALYEYADHIEDAYLSFAVPLFDRSVRKVQANPKKLYAIDPGIVQSLTLNNDLGKLFENVIFLDLKRLGYHVSYYLTSERFEIDFLVQSIQGQKQFVQVAWNMEDLQTLEREQRALDAGIAELKIEGKIITVDSYLREGIQIF